VLEEEKAKWFLLDNLEKSFDAGSLKLFIDSIDGRNQRTPAEITSLLSKQYR
jgi:hypothetical protein